MGSRNCANLGQGIEVFEVYFLCFEFERINKCYKRITGHIPTFVFLLCRVLPILGDPGAVSRVDKMFVVKVYCKIETSPWALTLTEPVPEAFELPASDWPEKNFSGQSAKRSCRVTLVFSYTT